jgi:disulfide bond formation protein DsbB
MENRYQKAYWLFLGIAIISLGISFFVEYVIEIRPCILCKLQRIPYFATGALALLGLIVSFKRALLRLIQVCFLAGVILASYHSCVQFGFLGSSCQTKKVEQTGPSWRIFGLPPPLYNGLFSLAVLIGTEIFLVRTRKKG